MLCGIARSSQNVLQQYKGTTSRPVVQRDVLTFGVYCCRAEAKRLRKVNSGLQATLDDVIAQREWEDLPSRWEARHAPCPASCLLMLQQSLLRHSRHA